MICTFLQTLVVGRDAEIRVLGNFIGGRDTSEVVDFSRPGQTVHAFRIAAFTDAQRRINEDLVETVFTDNIARGFSVGDLGGDKSADDEEAGII